MTRKILQIIPADGRFVAAFHRGDFKAFTTPVAAFALCVVGKGKHEHTEVMGIGCDDLCIMDDMDNFLGYIVYKLVT